MMNKPNDIPEFPVILCCVARPEEQPPNGVWLIGAFLFSLVLWGGIIYGFNVIWSLFK
jgi:hypothetical protein